LSVDNRVARRDLAESRAQEREVRFRESYIPRAKTGDTWSGHRRIASWLKSKQDAGEKIEKYLAN
jgi:DNA-binding protein H-NS